MQFPIPITKSIYAMRSFRSFDNVNDVHFCSNVNYWTIDCDHEHVWTRNRLSLFTQFTCRCHNFHDAEAMCVPRWKLHDVTVTSFQIVAVLLRIRFMNQKQSTQHKPLLRASVPPVYGRHDFYVYFVPSTSNRMSWIIHMSTEGKRMETTTKNSLFSFVWRLLLIRWYRGWVCEFSPSFFSVSHFILWCAHLICMHGQLCDSNCYGLIVIVRCRNRIFQRHIYFSNKLIAHTKCVFNRFFGQFAFVCAFKTLPSAILWQTKTQTKLNRKKKTEKIAQTFYE